MEIFKKVKLKLREIVVRFFVPIWDEVKDFISKYLKSALFVAGVLGLLPEFFTYNTVVDRLTLEEQILRINITLLRVSLLILLILLVYGFINFILKFRKWSLLVAGVLGLVLATNVLILINNSGSDSCTALYEIVTFIKGHQVLVSSITILALGLPTFFTLWLFRTHDTQENINNSTFFECARMLATKDSPEYSGKGPVKNRIEDPSPKKIEESNRNALKTQIENSSPNKIEESNGNALKTRIENSLLKKIALEQLAYLKRETSFDEKKIDLLTRNLFLEGKEFNHAQLSGIDLSGAKLKNTRLREADLRNAKLIGANLSHDKITSGTGLGEIETDLTWADLSGADLRGANLTGAKYGSLEGSDGDLVEALGRTKHGDDGKPILEGAIYNSEPISTGTIYIRKTIFPDWLDSKEKRKKAKMIDISTREEDPKNKSSLEK